ncbi:Polyketide cyclase / dehydrase and lipid transport [Hartmannibacter diazotrophicus]|uniref:Polyketide cyclase / dehydrase and lipid transport n=1 Tax=Hartmannibacter diazotrophicus TaxID=1482074 RepID=A0A2C9D307_9HYPH|nr:SRPBCC family protein [Hartmannibacter diazotrophicus]SON54692.1 Polyketide cyclase / dehydrase and lipid transport [Hartmannibacter diazotrophicus]
MTIRALALGLAASVIAITPAFAVETSKRVEDKSLKVETVWTTVGDFCGIGTWHPAVEKCELSEKDGATLRTLSLKGGGTIVEKLEKWDDAGTSYTYSIVESPLPVANYVSTISVAADDDGGASISWEGTFDAKGASDDEAKAVIDGIYEAGLNGIVEKAKSM